MISSDELLKLIAFSQKTGESLIVGLENGPVAIVPFERYRALATTHADSEIKQKTVSGVRKKTVREQKPVEKSSSDDEFLVEPLA